MAHNSEYTYEQQLPHRSVEEIAALLATTGRKPGSITNEEFTRTFQHFVDTDSLPLDMKYIVMLGVLVKAGLIKMPTSKREVWEALWNGKGEPDDDGDDDVTRDVTRAQDEEDAR